MVSEKIYTAEELESSDERYFISSGKGGKMKGTKTHNLKIMEDAADDIYSGRKTFDVRYNDRLYQSGDHIKYEVLERNTEITKKSHPFNGCEAEIVYVQSGYGLKSEYVVLGIVPFPNIVDRLNQNYK